MREPPSSFNLRCYVAAAEQLNFGRAARLVALTPSAFGQRIKQLEEQLGAELFERTTRSVALTDAGCALMPAAREALRSLDACLSAVLLDASPPISLTLGTRYELGLSWVVPALLAFEHEAPTWTVQTYFGSGPEIVRALEEGLVDAIVTSAPVARAEWATELLHPETYVFCGAPSLLLAQPFDGTADAAAHTLLDVDDTLPLARYLLSSAPTMAFGAVRTCGAHGAVQQLAVAAKGVAVLPEYSARPDIEAGRLAPILPHVTPLSDSFRLIFRAESQRAPELRALASWLRDRPLT